MCWNDLQLGSRWERTECVDSTSNLVVHAMNLGAHEPVEQEQTEFLEFGECSQYTFSVRDPVVDALFITKYCLELWGAKMKLWKQRNKLEKMLC